MHTEWEKRWGEPEPYSPNENELERGQVRERNETTAVLAQNRCRLAASGKTDILIYKQSPQKKPAMDKMQ